MNKSEQINELAGALDQVLRVRQMLGIGVANSTDGGVLHLQKVP